MQLSMMDAKLMVINLHYLTAKSILLLLLCCLNREVKAIISSDARNDSRIMKHDKMLKHHPNNIK